jgi:hypothetical protein
MKRSLARFSLTKTSLQEIHLQTSWKTLLICCSTKTILFFNWIVHLLILPTLSIPVCMWISQVNGEKREGPMVQPPHPPDLMPLDFLLGAIYKTRCTAKKWIRRMNSKHGLVQQLQMLQQSHSVMLQHIWQDVEYRWDVNRTTNGTHCESYCTQLFHLCVNKLF